MTFIWMIGGAAEPYVPAFSHKTHSSADGPAGKTEAADLDTHEPPSGSGGGGAKLREAEKAYRPSEDKAPRRQPALKAVQIMTSPAVTVQPTCSIPEAAGLLRQNGFRHLPVIAKDLSLVGMLSERNILRAGNATGKVEGIMTKKVLAASPEVEIREAARIMVDEGVRGLPLIDLNRRVVGIVTGTDILRCVVHRAPFDLWI